MMISPWFNPDGINNYETRRRPFQSKKVVSVGAKESADKKINPSQFTSWVALATSIVVTIIVVILILIYGEINATTTEINATTATSPSTALTTPALCPCQAASSNSLFFPYGEEAGDYTFGSRYFTVHILPNKFECRPLGNNFGLNDSTLYVFDYEPTVYFTCNQGRHVTYIAFTGFLETDTPKPANGSYFYHRKASKKENALFSCVIPDFKAVEVHVFTWINVTRNSGAEITGSFQFVYLVAEDSTAYVIKNYGDDFVSTPGVSSSLAIFSIFLSIFDTSVSVDEVRGKREIILFSDPIYGTKLPRTEEQKIGPCPEV